MKHKLTYTDNYLLVVDDSEIKEGEYYFNNTGLKIERYNHKLPSSGQFCKKITAHLPLNNSPILEGVPLLPPLVIENGKEDFIEYIKQKHNQERCVGFMDGWNKHAEKYKYTEEDMVDFTMKMIAQYVQGNTNIWNRELLKESLSSSKIKMPTHFECETEWVNSYGSPTVQYDAQELNPKTTTNSQGQTQWVGKWIYE